MTKTYLAKWTDGSISILTAENNFELFDKLDVEGDPTDAAVKVYRLPEDFHISAEGKMQGEKNFIDCQQHFEHNEEVMCKHIFPRNMAKRWLEQVRHHRIEEQQVEESLGIS